MSRKTDRHFQINKKVLEIIENPATIHYVAMKIIRPKPRLMPRFIWRALLSIVMHPDTHHA